MMSDPDKPRHRRIVRRQPSAPGERLSFRPGEIWRTFKAYFGLGRASKAEPIDNPEALARFLETRASFISQTSLYGYLRTRAGMRYPELFEDDPFVAGINIAKWHIWLACLSDIAVYTGSRLAQQAPRETLRIGRLVSSLVDGILEANGTPTEAGDEFAAHAQRVRERVARIDWLTVGADEAAFSESPTALIRWAPILEELKELDEEIVRNSVRFRWQEVRRDFARDLDAEAILRALPESVSG
jgi:hypothetical protein